MAAKRRSKKAPEESTESAEEQSSAPSEDTAVAPEPEPAPAPKPAPRRSKKGGDSYRVCDGVAVTTLGGVKGSLEPVALKDLNRDPEVAKARAAELVSKGKIEKA